MIKNFYESDFYFELINELDEIDDNWNYINTEE